MQQLRQQGHTEQTSNELNSIVHTLNAIQRQMAKMKHLQLQYQHHAQSPQQPGMPAYPGPMPQQGQMVNGTVQTPGIPMQQQMQMPMPPAQAQHQGEFMQGSLMSMEADV